MQLFGECEKLCGSLRYMSCLADFLFRLFHVGLSYLKQRRSIVAILLGASPMTVQWSFGNIPLSLLPDRLTWPSHRSQHNLIMATLVH